MIIGRLRRRERAGGQRPYVVQDVVHRHRLPLVAPADLAVAVGCRSLFPGGEYADAKKAAGQVARAVNMLRKAGCYGMTPKPPKTSPDKLCELCPTLSTVASLSWLSLEGSPDVF